VRRLIACGVVLAIGSGVAMLVGPAAVANEAHRATVQDLGEPGSEVAVVVPLSARQAASAAVRDFAGDPPNPSVKTFVPDIGPPDPMVAAGPSTILTSDSVTIEFFTKPTATTVARPLTLKGQSGAVIDATHFFAGVMKKANASGKLPAATCGDASQLPESPADNNREGFDPANAGCLLEAYDTRVYYDNVRGRYWILSAVRNWLWQCDGGVRASSVIPGEGPDVCHSGWGAQWPRRMVAVAVSKTSNPRKGFHKFLLNANDYEDWPQFVLHNHYLVVNHRDVPNGIGCGACVFVFDAERLADPPSGKDNSTFVRPLGTYPYVLFSTRGGASSRLYLVQSHGGRRDLTYIWTPVGDSWRLFALWSKHPGKEDDVPVLSYAGSVKLHRAMGSIRSNAVFRHNKIWLGASLCVLPNVAGGCFKYNMLLYDFAVRPSGASPPGFILARIHERVVSADAKSTAARTDSYQNPALEVTTNGDVVVVYDRTGLIATRTSSSPQDPPTQARYLVWRNGAADITTGRRLKNGSGAPSCPDPKTGKPSCRDPGEGGVVDLGGASVDPDGATVWISNAFATGGFYGHAVGAVKP
jgi:hypothetical protein